MQSEILSAAIIIIGNEILSGKTQDQNIQFIALELSDLGIKLKEIRVIPDLEDDIIASINLLRVKYTYVFTTGGIGPTHDDITAKTIAKAFNDEFILHDQAKEIIEQHLAKINRAAISGHNGYMRMAHMPKNAVPLLNRETGAPGFKLANVFVMAGVPYIMRAMFEEAKKFLKKANPIISKAVDVYLSEDAIAAEFSELQDKYPQIEMGSYPFKQENIWGTSLVLRGDNLELIEKALAELHQFLALISQDYYVAK
jgi:molybdenum cofactor synthesis domain-containing protein